MKGEPMPECYACGTDLPQQGIFVEARLCPDCAESRRITDAEEMARVYFDRSSEAVGQCPCCGLHARVRRITSFGYASAEWNLNVTQVCRNCFKWQVDSCPHCHIFFPVGMEGNCPDCGHALTLLGQPSGPRCGICQRAIRRADFLRLDVQQDGSYVIPTFPAFREAGKICCHNCYRRYASGYNALPDTSGLPVTSEANPYQRLVGFELEFHCHGVPRLWHLGSLHEDGSVYQQADGSIPREFSSIPLKGDALLSAIKQVGAELKRTEAYTDGRCGFHVHLDMRETSEAQRRRIAAYWREFEPVFFAMMTPNRRDNEYCRPREYPTPPGRNVRYRRYYALNTLAALERWGTFEVRLHHGTVDADEIAWWVMFLLRLFHAFERMPYSPIRHATLARMSPRERLKALRTWGNLSRQDWVTLVRRMRKYNTRHDFVLLTTRKKESR